MTPSFCDRLPRVVMPIVTSDVTATLALLRPNWQAARYDRKNIYNRNREHRQQHASSGMHTVVLFCRGLIMRTRPTVVVALSCYPFEPRYIGPRANAARRDTHRRGPDERTSAITHFVISTQTSPAPKPHLPALGRDCSPGVSCFISCSTCALLVACLAVFLALRIGRPDGGDDKDRRRL